MVGHGLPIIVTRGPMMDKPICPRENVSLASREILMRWQLLLEVMDHADLRHRLQAGVGLAYEWFSWDTALETRSQRLQSSLSTKGV